MFIINLLGCYFTYNGKSSDNYDLIFANVSSNTDTALSGGYELKTIYNKSNSYNYIIEHNYSDSVLELDVDIVTADASPLTETQQKEVRKWLFVQPSYRKLYSQESSDIYLNCIFTNPEKIEGSGGIIGYKTTIVCDSPTAWQDEIVYSNVLNLEKDEFTNITVSVNNELLSYIYPKVHIVIGDSGGNITIVNNSDDATRLTTFEYLAPDTDIQMDSSLNFVSGDNYAKMTDKNFIRLVDGDNIFTVTGNVDIIELTYNNRISF